ncbi:mitochondrial ribosomal protein L28-domain-containing protein [Mycotypha africana]|uniref:mitochondrial ribosomal protein L28-domain-containing protein n=1 Tax=Mycotypha africana TaxID=64632 RepID=UPI002301787F|nr:mitochondrial ribosomal protein L28-domain-containing protein [Mycotypha africana]KAI8988591.1 mitochondrial ribosomal protein L28-domain-containing protein [Mycotypha africana]
MSKTFRTVNPFRKATLSICQQQQKRWASANAATSSQGDPRLETIRRVLFEPPRREKTLELEGELLEQHETIERAWKLHKMRVREQRERTLERQFRTMNAAMTELEKTSNRLYKGAIVRSRHITYPRQAKIPTETPPTQGWDYSYKAPEESQS